MRWTRSCPKRREAPPASAKSILLMSSCKCKQERGEDPVILEIFSFPTDPPTFIGKLSISKKLPKRNGCGNARTWEANRK